MPYRVVISDDNTCSRRYPEKMNPVSDFQIGTNYCFFIPPGWIIVGKIALVTDSAIFLDDAFHLENVADGVSSLALGLVDKIEKAVTKSYPLPAGARIDLRAAL